MRVSAEAGKLLAHIKAQPLAVLTLEELAQDVRMSRAKVSQCLRELDEAGAVTLHIEEE